MFAVLHPRQPREPVGSLHVRPVVLEGGRSGAGADQASTRRSVSIPSTGRACSTPRACCWTPAGRSEALDRIERAWPSSRSRAEGLRLLGRARNELRQMPEAIDAYQRAIALDERDVWAMNNLGLIYIQQDRSDDALRSARPGGGAAARRAGVPEQPGHGAGALRPYPPRRRRPTRPRSKWTAPTPRPRRASPASPRWPRGDATAGGSEHVRGGVSRAGRAVAGDCGWIRPKTLRVGETAYRSEEVKGSGVIAYFTFHCRRFRSLIVTTALNTCPILTSTFFLHRREAEAAHAELVAAGEELGKAEHVVRAAGRRWCGRRAPARLPARARPRRCTRAPRSP